MANGKTKIELIALIPAVYLTRKSNISITWANKKLLIFLPDRLKHKSKSERNKNSFFAICCSPKTSFFNWATDMKKRTFVDSTQTTVVHLIRAVENDYKFTQSFPHVLEQISGTIVQWHWHS